MGSGGEVASTFAWLDHSEAHRKRMMEVVGLFREKGTVDELGIGSVRDTLSEILFPGTSTLHTRARYLLFVPWIARGMEHERVPSRRAQDQLEEREAALIDALDAGGERQGVIGIEARASLKQWPSSMYWSAFEAYGIRVTPASKGQYLKSLDGYYARLKDVRTNDDGEPIGDGAPRNWHANLPEAPDGFLEETSFDLTPGEGDYLTERVVDRCQGSFLAHLVIEEEADVEAAFPWMHPAAQSASPKIREHIAHARVFSEVMHGAALLYNLILAERVRDARSAGGEFEVDEDLADHYRDQLEGWVAMMADRHAAHRDWDRPTFWQVVSRHNPRVPGRTVQFITDWTQRAIAAPEQMIDDADARDLVANRERAVKRSLARVHNLRALERWSGASGTAQLAFRWGNASRMANDIRAGRDRAPEVAGARA